MVLMSEWVYGNGDRQWEGATGSLIFFAARVDFTEVPIQAALQAS